MTQQDCNVTYYKVLSKDGCACHGGHGKWHLPKQLPDGTWKPGRWMPNIKDPIPCERGYHLFERKNVLNWLGDTCYEAEYRGVMVGRGDKIVVESARLLRPVSDWNEKTLRLFACRCAEDVLPPFERLYPADGRPRHVVEVARRYANGEAADIERAAAGVAAAASASVAAGVAAWDAACASAAVAAGAGAAARAKYIEWLWEMVGCQIT